MYWSVLLIFFIVALVCSAVGFKKYVYFMSIGYGFSVAGIGLALVILAFTQIAGGANIWVLLYPILFIVYGFRLSGFLAIRELKNAAYKKTLNEATGSDKLPIFVMVSIWIMCAVLYVAQTVPAFYRFANGYDLTVCLIIGLVISVAGVVLESIADKQKSVQKAANPDMVATKGLYKYVRCPNYFGEILFWTGVMVSGFDVLEGFGQWILAIIGYICIVLVMFNGAQRLEKRQMKRYGDNTEYNEYNEYANKTPIIIPLIPLYHLNKPGQK